MNQIKHIFWDWNGTLLDDAWLCRDVMNRMLRKRRMAEMTAERYQEVFDFPIVHYYERLGFDFTVETFEDLGREFIDGYEIRRHEALLYEDVLTVLESVKSRGVGQSILSAYHHHTLVSLVENHRLGEYFQTLHGHQHIYPADKAPQGREALETLGLDPAETVLIGDTSHDKDVAEELGMQCILIPGGNQPETVLRGLGVPCVESRFQAMEVLFT
jgi:phosphoglycolate phosphatase